MDANTYPALVARDRYRGLFLGLALGDALGSSVQHRRPGTFDRVGNLMGGGPYELPLGAWTDDTALALALAESLSTCGAYEPDDVRGRLRRWQTTGEGSATGQCLGITAALAGALLPDGVSCPRSEREALPRAGIAAAFELEDVERALELTSETVRLTHHAVPVVDAARYAAALVFGALSGESRERLLAPFYEPVEGLWRRHPLCREVTDIAAGDWRRHLETKDAGQGDAPSGLGLALAALAAGTSYRDTVLCVVNYGRDADMNGALAGMLAGAIYGADAIPPAWRASLVNASRIGAAADGLLVAALSRLIESRDAECV
jgi:ADP-ribosyl-[dinitrogen reductase] hydrolase